MAQQTDILKAEELRLGNKIYIDDLNIDTGNWHQRITDLDYRDIYNLVNAHDSVKKSYQGIPITEEILLKAGLQKEADHIFVLPNNSFRLWGFAWNLQQYVIIDKWIDIHSKSIKYFHQLQNLYYALTQEELTFK
jgi:hypothetical protein